MENTEIYEMTNTEIYEMTKENYSIHGDLLYFPGDLNRADVDGDYYQLTSEDFNTVYENSFNHDFFEKLWNLVTIGLDDFSIEKLTAFVFENDTPILDYWKQYSVRGEWGEYGKLELIEGV